MNLPILSILIFFPMLGVVDFIYPDLLPHAGGGADHHAESGKPVGD
ncbi:MAG: hypothetical protein JRI57_04200 [Deltaproteobacteria bacterium]|nr:hypothetical protein [Deltaproteobacteria bacterium]